jgi:hypothetical protein
MICEGMDHHLRRHAPAGPEAGLKIAVSFEY